MLPAIFADVPLCHGDAAVQTIDGTTVIRTPPEQWAYAASYSRLDTAELKGALVVHVVLQVTQGSVGVGCLAADGTVFLDEVFVGPSMAASAVDVVVVQPGPVGDLVVRNASSDGRSEVRVIDVQWSSIDDRDEARHPPLSEPRPIPGWSRYYAGNGGTAVERLRAWRFRALESPRTISWTNGTSLSIRPGDQLSRAVYISGTYEPNTLTVLKALTPTGGVFLDIGANVGVVTLAAAAWVGPLGRVFSFEPSEREFGRLLDNLHGNQLEHVVAVRAAVADAEGEITLQVATDEFAGLNTIGTEFSYAGVGTERLERLEAITVDAFASEHQLSRIDVMKIDVEGAEGAVLAGASQVLRSRRPAVIAEVFSRSLQANGWDRARLARLFATVGYELFAIDDATAQLIRLRTLDDIDEENVVALPAERVDSTLTRLAQSR